MSIKIELNEPQKQEDIKIMLKNESSGNGGVEDYRYLLNLPKVNGVTLLGNKTSSDLGLQPQGDYALKSSIPTKTSQLINDSGFITKHQDISNLVTKEELNQKQDIISDLSTIRSNASKGATAVQPSQLSTVAISGSYNDLKDKPVISEGGGGTTIDAYTKSETNLLLEQKQDKLIAGDNITIEGNVISSTGGSGQIDSSGLGFPSDKYIDLTLGASQEFYIAPDDGWFYLSKQSGQATSYCTVVDANTGISISQYNTSTGQYARILYPVKKGREIQVVYNSTGSVQMFRFFYAREEV